MHFVPIRATASPKGCRMAAARAGRRMQAFSSATCSSTAHPFPTTIRYAIEVSRGRQDMLFSRRGITPSPALLYAHYRRCYQPAVCEPVAFCRRSLRSAVRRGVSLLVGD